MPSHAAIFNGCCLLLRNGVCLSRPYTAVNCASSIDGKLSTASRRRVLLSCRDDINRLMKLRSSFDAVAVGIGTVLADDPSLTVRHHRGKHPVRVIFDSRGRLPDDAKVLDGQAETIVFTAEECEREVRDARVLRCGSGRVDLKRASSLLHKMGVKSLLVEGGGELIFGFLSAGLVDTLTVYTAPVVIGGSDAPTIADGEGFADARSFAHFRLESVKPLGPGFISTYGRGRNGRG